MSETTIDPTAVVEPGAQLGSGVFVGPFCLIGSNVRIGVGCRLISHVSIRGHTTLGADNEVFPFASLGSAPKELNNVGDPNRV